MNKRIVKLKEHLAGELPGEEAQYKMSPRRKRNPIFKSSFEFKKSAVAILIYEKSGDLYFPIIVRSDYGGVHSGQLALPGGKVDFFDKDLKETALREMKEEIGFSDDVDYLGQLSSLKVDASKFEIHPHVFYYSDKPRFTINPAEVAELIEFKIDDLLNDRLVKSTTVEVYTGAQIKTPYFDVRGKVLWGATAMILSELKHLLNK